MNGQAMNDPEDADAQRLLAELNIFAAALAYRQARDNLAKIEAGMLEEFEANRLDWELE